MTIYDYLLTQKIFSLPNTPDVLSRSAKLCFVLRREGAAVRNAVDVPIAYTAIYYDLQLLHNDVNFDYIADRMLELRVV